ncbi:glycine--tRNA ligase subunit beta [Pseudonocardia sp. TMWB2A]|uniref:glycine--tRNA ligase subunit beta n=1 Tax=Pseudonocardia sp. TMWB2A TaxID=687430 RepID=UPI00307F9E6F
MTDFLLELLSEEIPARMQGKAKDDLARLFTDALAKAGLQADSVETFATPRRLALIAKGLPLETAAVSEETKGPKVGAPPQALEGFLRKTGLTQDALVERDGVYFAVVNKPGRKTADVLAEAIPAIIRAFPWPKSMRWGKASASTESLRWVRPLQGIVALLGDDVVPCAIDGLNSGRDTMGHRFHHSGPVSITNAGDYEAKLRAAHVILHFSERCAIIRDTAKKLAADKGLVWIEDEALVAENAGLTEWPVPLIGDFDPAFLEVPREVIQLTLATNQKYFVCGYPPRNGEGDHAQHGGGGLPSGTAPDDTPPPSVADATATSPSRGGLAPAFICTANIDARDGGAAIVAGNRKVLAARLSDARFFWEQDQKKTLADHAEGLKRITFHEKLGTVADKVDRVAKLARWLVEEGIVTDSPLPFGRGAAEPYERSELGERGGVSPAGAAPVDRPHPNPSPKGEGLSLADLAEQAARLAKADLVTEMVGEFPELQGVMGGYYAAKEGLPIEVSNAIRDHYKPAGQGDDVPAAPVTVAVSLADKLDTLVGFFTAGESPTGSKDPFALRRSTLGIIATIVTNCRVGLGGLISKSAEIHWSEHDHGTPADVHEAWRRSFENFKWSDSFTGVRPDPQSVGAGAGGYWKSAFTFGLFDLPIFFADRLKVQQKEAGVRHDLIDAVFALGGEDDLVRLLARVHALQSFISTDDGANLLAGYKRAANLLKQAGDSPLPFRGGAAEPYERSELGERGGVSPASAGVVDRPHPNPSPEGEGLSDAETALLTALDAAEPKASAAVEAEDFEGAMAALATLRAPIDAFFEAVMVNDPDPDKRAFRLGLLARVRDAVHKVADFSRIES